MRHPGGQLIGKEGEGLSECCVLSLKERARSSCSGLADQHAGIKSRCLNGCKRNSLLCEHVQPDLSLCFLVNQAWTAPHSELVVFKGC